jgi:hypothetical protein
MTRRKGYARMPTLDWIGKAAVEKHRGRVPYHLLRCGRELSAGDPDAGNLLVQGDNLLGLKALLPYYAGKVKCIYIDPPYNTGNEKWAYNDNVNSPEMRKWLGEVVDADKLDRHDRWLCMMYPRLALLRDFLTEDGVIFISIDDNEVHHLLNLMNDLFGADRKVAVFTWVRKKKGSNLSKEFRKVTEYVVAYKRSKAKLELYGIPAYAEKQVPLLNRANPVSSLRFPAMSVRVGRGIGNGETLPAEGGRGELVVRLSPRVVARDGRVAGEFEITGRWRWSQATLDEELSCGSLFSISKDLRINVSRHNQADKFRRCPACS